MKGSITISKPTFGDGRKKVSIRISDEASRVCFVDALIDYDAFTEALFGRGDVDVDLNVSGLEVVGKQIQTRIVEAEMPKKYDFKKRAKIAKERVQKAIDSEGGGWSASGYFGSKGSFFDVDGVEFCRGEAVRYVEVKE